MGENQGQGRRRRKKWNTVRPFQNAVHKCTKLYEFFRNSGHQVFDLVYTGRTQIETFLLMPPISPIKESITC